MPAKAYMMLKEKLPEHCHETLLEGFKDLFGVWNEVPVSVKSP